MLMLRLASLLIVMSLISGPGLAQSPRHEDAASLLSRLVAEKAQTLTIDHPELLGRYNDRYRGAEVVFSGRIGDIEDCTSFNRAASWEYKDAACFRMYLKLDVFQAMFVFISPEFLRDNRSRLRKGYPIRDTCIVSRIASAAVGATMFCDLRGVTPTVHKERAARCLREGDVATLAGRVTRETFPGPPGYSSLANGDEPQTYWILTTTLPQCFMEGSPMGGPATGERVELSRIQLAFDTGEGYKTHAAAVGASVVAVGKVFEGVTAHHKTRALLTVRSLTVLPGAPQGAPRDARP